MADSARTADEMLKLSGRCWSVIDGSCLLEGVPGNWPHNPPSQVELPGGLIIKRPSAYYFFTNKGVLTAIYSAPYAYSLEDTLYVMDIHAVVDGQLLRYLWEWQWRHEPRVSVADIVLAGLTEISNDGIPFDMNRIPAPK